MLEKRAVAVRALEELLSRRRAVLAVEATGVSSAVAVSVARATGYAVARVARSYVIGRTPGDIEAFLAELLDQLLKQLKRHVAGRKSKMCCVKLRKATRGNPAPVSLYVELLRKAQEVKIIRLSERGYRACVQSP